MRIKNHSNGFTLSLALKQRFESTRKWSTHVSVVCFRLIYNPGQNYLRICTLPCTLSNTTTLLQQQLICGTKCPSPQVNVVSYKCLRIRVALEHTTTLLPRGGGKGGRGITRMLGKMLCECDIFSTVLSKIVHYRINRDFVFHSIFCVPLLS